VTRRRRGSATSPITAPHASSASLHGELDARTIGGEPSVLLPVVAASFIDIMSQLPSTAPQ
jgi:hypothetical protein